MIHFRNPCILRTDSSHGCFSQPVLYDGTIVMSRSREAYAHDRQWCKDTAKFHLSQACVRTYARQVVAFFHKRAWTCAFWTTFNFQTKCKIVSSWCSHLLDQIAVLWEVSRHRYRDIQKQWCYFNRFQGSMSDRCCSGDFLRLSDEAVHRLWYTSYIEFTAESIAKMLRSNFGYWYSCWIFEIRCWSIFEAKIFLL